MDDGEVNRLCAAAAAEIADARSALLAAAGVEWQGQAADRYRGLVEELLTDLTRASARLERARSVAAAAAARRATAAGLVGGGA